MHALSNLDDDDDIDQILQTLPKDINESYANAILRVNNKDDARKKYARMILAWMAYVFRPLTFQELSHAIASQKSRAVVKLDKLLSKERIMSYCCGLVEIDIDDIVRFVHYSAQDFFRRKRDSEFYEFREQIPLACAKYLCMGGLVSSEELDHGSASSVDDLPRDETPKLRDYSPVECATDNVHNHLQTSYQQEKPTIDSFMKYAAESLHKHFETVREQEKSTDLFRYIRQLVEEKPKRRLYYSCVAPNGYYTPSSLLGESSRQYSSGNNAAKSLHLSVFLGCPILVMNLIEKGADVNELDEFDQTPLAIAFKRNFSDIAALLLDHGATVDLTRKQGHTFLLYAAQRDFDAAVGKMLNKTRGSEFIWPPRQLDAPSVAPLPRRYTYTGILKDVHIKSRFISTFRSLRDRSEQDTAEPIDANEMLLRFGRILSLAYYGHIDELGRVADFPEFSDNRYDGPCICARDFLETACFLAVERGHAEIVEACLRGPHALDPNLKNFCGQPLLHRATFRNNITLVRLILDSGANANREDDNGRTAFTAHATMDREEVLSFLQTNGADIHHTGSHGVHELYRASAFGNIDMVRFFLDRGIDASITNIFSWKPLHEASANGHLECVKLLLEHGAHPSPISDVGKTPLDLMIEGDVHYDWPLLGDDSEHYLNGEPYKKKELGPEDIERRDEIVDLLKRHGAETADQLYAKDKSAFGHVAAGRYARGYESWETDWDE